MKIWYQQWGLTWGKSLKETLPSRFGILEVNEGSAPCGSVIVVEFPPLCNYVLLRYLWSLLFGRQILMYCVGNICRYVIDAADRDSVPISRSELHDLLTKPSLNGIPLLILGNKIDKSEALSKPALVDQL